MSLGVLQVMSVIVALTLTLSMSPFAEALAGGEPAKPGEFPHAVQLSDNNTGEYFCGGSIISPNVVITAAHCVYLKRNPAPEIPSLVPLPLGDITLVTAGTLENQNGKYLQKGLQQTGDGIAQIRTVDRYVIHPGFNRSSLQNDIALLIFVDPLTYTDNVKAIQLPPPNATYSGGTFAGWGITDGRNLSSPYLKKMEVVFEDRHSCNSDPLMMMEPKWGKVTDLGLCSKMSKGNSGCRGDAGSSVICQGSNTTATLHNNGTSNSSLSPTICGIAAYGKGNGLCGESDLIVVFVDVSKYLDWIQKEAERNVNSVKTIKMIEKILTFLFYGLICIMIFLSLLLICCLIVGGIVALFILCFCKIQKMCLSRATSENQVA